MSNVTITPIGQSANPVAASGASAGAPPHPLREMWGYFRQNRGAVIGLVVVAVVFLLALLADVVAPHAAAEQFRDATLVPPVWQDGGSSKFIFGTDPVGRDILSRLIYGT